MAMKMAAKRSGPLPAFAAALETLLVVSALSAPAGGCDRLGVVQDPVRRAEIEAQGPEDPAVPPGPLHRPGQACAVCHADDGTAAPYVFAGTVFRDPEANVAVADVAVMFVDAKGRTFTAKTNCAGNFYVKPAELTPTAPTWVTVQSTGFPVEMSSPMHREASCAKCHSDPLGPASAGHVFLTNDKSMYASIPIRPCGPQDGVAR